MLAFLTSALFAASGVYAVLAIIEVGLLLRYIKLGAPDQVATEPFQKDDQDEDAKLYFAY